MKRINQCASSQGARTVERPVPIADGDAAEFRFNIEADEVGPIPSMLRLVCGSVEQNQPMTTTHDDNATTWRDLADCASSARAAMSGGSRSAMI